MKPAITIGLHVLLYVASPAALLAQDTPKPTPKATPKAKAIPALDFATTKTPAGCQDYARELGRLRGKITKMKKPASLAQLVALEKVVVESWQRGQTTRRMLAIRTIGTLACRKGASPILHDRLLEATRANSRRVQWEAVVQLYNVPYTGTKLRESTSSALLAVARAHKNDRALSELASNAAALIAKPHAKKKTGFTLFPGRRMRANESAAIATLRNFCSAQAQTQASGVIDVDADGAGEYGFLKEMSGGIGLRNDAKGGIGAKKLNPPVLSGAFQKVNKGYVIRSGYCYMVFLPGKNGAPVPEADKGGATGRKIDADLAETTWCVYAWPLVYGKTGKTVYFTNQNGDVMAADNLTTRYSGDWMPQGDAAFVGNDKIEARITGKVAMPQAAIRGGRRVVGFGRDGNLWGVWAGFARPR